MARDGFADISFAGIGFAGIGSLDIGFPDMAPSSEHAMRFTEARFKNRRTASLSADLTADRTRPFGEA